MKTDMEKAIKAIIINDKKKILLLKRKPYFLRKKVKKHLKKYVHLDKKNIWDLPGGRMKSDETEKQALKREVFEELQLDIKILKKHSSWKFKDSFEDYTVKVNNYLCIINNIKDLKLSDEHETYKWIFPKDIRKYKVKDESLYQILENLKK